MIDGARELLIGIDGGGTDTVTYLGVLGDTDSFVVAGRGKSGSSNRNAVGLETALGHLDQSIQFAFEDAKIPRQPATSACLALAGVDRATQHAPFKVWAEELQLSKHLLVSNDALPVIYAANRDGLGLALIAGTGSLCLGRTESGYTARCGGWGGLFGDEGSGYRIAIEALRAAARDEDGRGPSTELLTGLRDRLDVHKLYHAIPLLYDPRTSRAEIASYAPLVFEIAENGDPVAAKIIEQAAISLSELVTTVHAKLNQSPLPPTVGLAGGVLTRQLAFSKRVAQKTENQMQSPIETVIVTEPALGALRMAQLNIRD